MSKTSQLFGDVFWPLSFSFLKPAHTHTHTHICCNNYILHSHTPPPHAKTLCYINMQQSLWCITSSQMDCLMARGSVQKVRTSVTQTSSAPKTKRQLRRMAKLKASLVNHMTSVDASYVISAVESGADW